MIKKNPKKNIKRILWWENVVWLPFCCNENQIGLKNVVITKKLVTETFVWSNILLMLFFKWDFCVYQKYSGNFYCDENKCVMKKNVKSFFLVFTQKLQQHILKDFFLERNLFCDQHIIVMKTFWWWKRFMITCFFYEKLISVMKKKI